MAAAQVLRDDIAALEEQTKSLDRTEAAAAANNLLQVRKLCYTNLEWRAYAAQDELKTFEVRDSMFIGPPGKAVKFETTFHVLEDGVRRFSTVMPFGGGGDMKFPMPDDFLQEFGIVPNCVDEENCYFQYAYGSKSGRSEVVFSFNGVSESFQVNLFSCDEEIMVVSSERVNSVLIFKETLASGVRVIFDYQGNSSEATIVLEPDLKIGWWILRK